MGPQYGINSWEEMTDRFIERAVEEQLPVRLVNLNRWPKPVNTSDASGPALEEVTANSTNDTELTKN